MIIFTIIGALIGAGFASGQEIYLFFYRFGIIGLVGVMICSIIISFIIYKALNIVYKYDIDNYGNFLNIIFKNKKIIFLTNVVINIFLAMTFFIMISGFGAYFKQELGVNNIIGASILAIISYIIFLGNIDNITKINSIIVPSLIIFIFIIGIENLFLMDINNIEFNLELKNSVFSFIQAIIYASYNLILLIPVLINLKKFIKGKKHITIVAIFTGVILCSLSILIFLLLTNVDISFLDLEMPIVYVIKNKFFKFSKIYGFIILIAIFTTAISVGVSFLNNVCKNKKSFPQIAALMCISSVLISNFGFSNLVKILFPFFGYLGLIQITYITKV